jgi:hypothetical protein
VEITRSAIAFLLRIKLGDIYYLPLRIDSLKQNYRVKEYEHFKAFDPYCRIVLQRAVSISTAINSNEAIREAFLQLSSFSKYIAFLSSLQSLKKQVNILFITFPGLTCVHVLFSFNPYCMHYLKRITNKGIWQFGFGNNSFFIYSLCLLGLFMLEGPSYRNMFLQMRQRREILYWLTQ